MLDIRLYSIALLILLYNGAAWSDKSDDCTEVGYARSAGILLPQAYDEVKEAMLQRWVQEDKDKQPPYTHLQGSMKNVTRAAYLLEEVSKEVVARVRKTRVGKRCQAEWLLRGVEKHVKPLVNLDQQLTDTLGLVMSFRCMVGSPYPNVDGTCVSEESPDMGAIGAKFLRLLPPKPGSDGFSIRESVAGDKPLPSARSVAEVIRAQLQRPAVTHLFTSWGHFVQQDIFNIPESPLSEGVDCCSTPDAEDCAAIPVPEGDPLREEAQCINFRRAARAQAILGHRESFSLVSTYLDATPLYGPTNDVAFTHKTGYFGYLKGGERLEEADTGPPCLAPQSWDHCFDADHTGGSVRSLLMLEHNRIADELSELNPHFDDALLYNEARRIVIASYAVVTYGNYLRVLMGNDTLYKHHLYPGATGPAAQYIKDVNPGVLTSFATAAFRNPAMLTEYRLEASDTTAASRRDEYFASNHYDSVKTLSYQDILALDVQRGRDHGLAGYLHWRRFCDPGLVLESWDDLGKILSEPAMEALRELYGEEELEDLDAMVALLEPPVEGGVAGKTFTCIMADQFARLRTGNRLFWEHPAAMLTQEQITAIRASTMTQLLCANLPVEEVPKNPLLPKSDDDNPMVKCSDVPMLNLTAWTDTSLIESMKDVKKEQPPTVIPQQQDEQQAEDSPRKADGGVSGETASNDQQTPPLAASTDEKSSAPVLTSTGKEAADERRPTERMAASVVDAGPRLTATDAREEL